MRDLRKREVVLLSSTGDDTGDENLERKMLRQMLAVFAEYERGSIVLKLRGARDRKRAATGRCEGRKPYGVKLGEAVVLERMLTMRQAGETFEAIARALNAEGIKPRGTKTRGPGQWFGSTVQNILAARAK